MRLEPTPTDLCAPREVKHVVHHAHEAACLVDDRLDGESAVRVGTHSSKLQRLAEQQNLREWRA